MNDGRSTTADDPRDADRMRRQFLLAREQLAAHSLERYFAVREMRRATQREERPRP